MATYNTAFGSLPGTNEMLGTTNTTGGGQQQVYNPQRKQRRRQSAEYGGGQTFAQMQKEGQARPAPPMAGATQQQPMMQQLSQKLGQQPSPQTQANAAPQASDFQQRLQQNLQGLRGSYSRYGTEEFQQIRGAQAENLQAEYEGQRKALDEDLARRGLFASSIGGGRLGDLAGQQARALSTLDADLLKQAAETQAADREVENSLRLQEAALTGVYGDGKTLAAEQQAVAQELALATLTGKYRGEKTQSAKEFDIEQAIKEKLGLGSLSLEQQKINEQAKQFGMSLDENKAARLQQYGLSVQDLGLKTQQLKQEAELQGRQMNITEAQYLAQNKLEAEKIREQATQFGLTLDENKASRLQQFDISTKDLALKTMQVQQQDRSLDLQQAQNLAQNELEKQRITEQGKQFGLSLDEQKAARMQQGGFTVQELALKTKDVENQARLEGRRLDITEAQNTALNDLEADKLSSDNAFRTRQLNISQNELDMRANQIKEDQRLRGVEIANDKAYREAELGIRTTQIKNEYERSGQQITVDQARVKAQEDIAKADNAAQLERLNKQISEQGRQFDLESKLREALGMSEMSGYVYDPRTGQRTSQETVQGQIARNQTLLSLAQALGGLSQEQIARLFGGGTTGGGTVTTQSGGNTGGGGTTTTRDAGVTTTTTQSERPNNPPANPTEGQTWTDSANRTWLFTGGQWVRRTTTTSSTGTTTTSSTVTTTTSSNTTTTQQPWANWTPSQLNSQGYLTRASIAGTPIEGVWDNPVRAAYRIGRYRVFHDGTGWKAILVQD